MLTVCKKVSGTLSLAVKAAKVDAASPIAEVAWRGRTRLQGKTRYFRRRFRALRVFGGK